MIDPQEVYEAALSKAVDLLDFAEGKIAERHLPEYFETGEHNAISREVESAKELAALYVGLANAARPSETND